MVDVNSDPVAAAEESDDSDTIYKPQIDILDEIEKEKNRLRQHKSHQAKTMAPN